MTEDEKRKAYAEGRYYCAVPFVHSQWTREDWIRWIDKTGGWTEG